jgi:carboxylesterase 2
MKIKDIIERSGLQFGPIPDGATHVLDVRKNFKNRKAAKVPMIMGTNADEGRPFLAVGLSGGGTLADFIGQYIGNKALGKTVIKTVKGLYPSNQFPNDMEFGSQFLTDIAFQCPIGIFTKALAEANYTVYRYFFGAAYPEQEPIPGLRAYHSSEITNIFGSYKPENSKLDRLSDVLQGIWTDFAKDPNKAPANWPKLSRTSNLVREFKNDADRTIDGTALDAPRCGRIGPLSALAGI